MIATRTDPVLMFSNLLLGWESKTSSRMVVKVALEILKDKKSALLAGDIMIV